MLGLIVVNRYCEGDVGTPVTSHRRGRKLKPRQNTNDTMAWSNSTNDFPFIPEGAETPIPISVSQNVEEITIMENGTFVVTESEYGLVRFYCKQNSFQD